VPKNPNATAKESVKEATTDELKYVYEIKENKFKEQVEKQKKEREQNIEEKLREIKSKNKPVQREEIDEFKSKMDEAKQEMLLKKERERALRLEKIEEDNQNLPKPESQFYLKALQVDKEQKEAQEQQILEKKYKQMKQKNFSKAVKENIVVKIDENLKEKAALEKEKLLNPQLYIEHHHKRKKAESSSQKSRSKTSS